MNIYKINHAVNQKAETSVELKLNTIKIMIKNTHRK